MGISSIGKLFQAKTESEKHRRLRVKIKLKRIQIEAAERELINLQESLIRLTREEAEAAKRKRHRRPNEYRRY